MEREWTVEESVRVAASPDEVYAAVADLRRMPEWSPELFRVWVRDGGEVGEGTRFVGFNRLGWRIWFTTCEVTAAIPGRALAFRVTTFGMPVALWGYRVEGIGEGTGEDAGASRLAEYWQDLRRDSRTAGIASLLGRVFTGVRAEDRAELNRRGMRATLDRVRASLES
ncbi:SRPBCC family protein [Actinomadura harenae]|uniref:SRPBCC family protein n=1 Tax=Actinomadura harenae TaxID=2483351 RepID=A0A3M2MBR0_9ACTN|nr:SRPBCC family protein [Actinomadura harenae]RMI47047.1 SRPBCC family protein [Actinomadura harenae]